MPEVTAFHNADTPISTGTSLTALASLNSETRDTDGMHSLVSDTGRLTIKTAGLYLLTARVNWDLSANGYRTLAIREDGSQLRGAKTRWTRQTTYLKHSFSVGCIVNAAVDQYYEVLVQQNSGGDLDINYLAGESPYFTAVRLASTIYAMAHNTAAQTIASGATWQGLILPTEDLDTDTMWDTGANGRFTINTAGRYLLFGQMKWPANADNWRANHFRVSGEDDQICGGTTFVPGSAVACYDQILTALDLQVDDYVEYRCRQASTVSLNTVAESGLTTYAAIVMLPAAL